MEEQPMADSLQVAKADELSPGQARRVKVHGKRLALFNIDGNFYALEDTCDHKGGPLSGGAVAGARGVLRNCQGSVISSPLGAARAASGNPR